MSTVMTFLYHPPNSYFLNVIVPGSNPLGVGNQPFVDASFLCSTPVSTNLHCPPSYTRLALV